MLSNRLKNLRLEKDVLQKDVAQHLNITTSAYGFYEQGKRTPDIEIVTKLANYFNVSIDYLMGVSDIREPADKLVKKAQDTIALHRNDGYDDDLPEEARKEIEDFKEYVRHKYGKKKD